MVSYCQKNDASIVILSHLIVIRLAIAGPKNTI
jgi:hypothetical protein